MSAPSKPWERDFVGTPGLDQRIRLESSATLPATTMMGSQTRPVRLQQVPSVPARPWLSRPQTRFSTFNTPSPYMLGGYGGYGAGYGSYGGGYGGYGGYTAPYGGYRSYGAANRYGVEASDDPEHRFIQIAEEATRPAFDSIQSVVDAFGSVSFMLESTYQAVVHTFRAVLGIAEHLGQLRSIFAAINVFRLVRWAYNKICQLLGIKTSEESLWYDATTTSGIQQVDNLEQVSAPRWPIFIYFTIVVSGPLLMWRLLKSLSIGNQGTRRQWDPTIEPSSQFAVVMYPFTAQTNKEVSVNAGKMVALAPNQYQTNLSSGWALVTADRTTTGLIPLNYIQQVQYLPNSSKQQGAAGGTGRTTMASYTTNREAAPTQQNMNGFPVTANSNATGTPLFTSMEEAATSSDKKPAAVVDGFTETVPLPAGVIEPAMTLSQYSDMLPTLSVPEQEDTSANVINTGTPTQQNKDATTTSSSSSSS